MKTFIKTKFKKSDDQTNIEYTLAANITEYHIILKLIFFRNSFNINLVLNWTY